MFKKVSLLVALLSMVTAAYADPQYKVAFNFDTSWNTDYAPGWENSAYRHGPAPVGKMMDFYAGGYSGGGMRLVADSTPESWMWWAAVNPMDINYNKMAKQYDPYVSVRYYDESWVTETSNLHRAGQLYAVPSWVNGYTGTNGDEDWTDIQFGARMNQATPADNYYYVAAGETSPGWQDTGVDRSAGWHTLKMQLSSGDGKVHFILDGVEVGASYRDDYEDLGDVGLYTMFTAPLSSWTLNKPSTIWDDFEFGSSAVPAPGAALLAMLGLSIVGWIKRRLA